MTRSQLPLPAVCCAFALAAGCSAVEPLQSAAPHASRAAANDAGRSASNAGGTVARDSGAGPQLDSSRSTTLDAGDSSGPHCTSTPTLLIRSEDLVRDASSVSSGMDLAVDERDVFVAVNYAPGGVLLRAPLAGGPASIVTRFAGTEAAMLLRGGSLVFEQFRIDAQDAESGEIVRVDLASGESTVLATLRAAPGNILVPSTLASDGDQVYFAALDGVKSVPLRGGMQRTLTTQTGTVGLVGSTLLVADSAAHAIFSVPTGGGPTTTLASDPAMYLGPVIGCGGDDVCWTTVTLSPSCCVELIGDIVRLTPGHDPVSLTNGNQLSSVAQLLFDGMYFFVGTVADASVESISRLPASGGEVEFIGRGGVAIDADCVYTANVFSGVQSVLKSASVQGNQL